MHSEYRDLFLLFNKAIIWDNIIHVSKSSKKMPLILFIYLEQAVQKVRFTLCSLHTNVEHLSETFLSLEQSQN